MADYFTNFSVVIKLANETEQAYALDLAHKASLAQQGDELPADFPKDLVDMIEDWHFEMEADNSGTTHGLWLHSMYGGVDAVCAFIQHLLQKFDPQVDVLRTTLDFDTREEFRGVGCGLAQWFEQPSRDKDRDVGLTKTQENSDVLNFQPGWELIEWRTGR